MIGLSCLTSYVIAASRVPENPPLQLLPSGVRPNYENSINTPQENQIIEKDEALPDAPVYSVENNESSLSNENMLYRVLAFLVVLFSALIAYGYWRFKTNKKK